MTGPCPSTRTNVPGDRGRSTRDNFAGLKFRVVTNADVMRFHSKRVYRSRSTKRTSSQFAGKTEKNFQPCQISTEKSQFDFRHRGDDDFTMRIKLKLARTSSSRFASRRVINLRRYRRGWKFSRARHKFTRASHARCPRACLSII